MKLAQKYLDAIESQDTLRLQMMLVTIIYSDQGFTTTHFEETLNAIEANIKNTNCPEIIVRHEGNINLDKTQWDEDYYCQALAELRGNFSRERINHVKEVGRYLYAQEKNMNTGLAPNNVNKATKRQEKYRKPKGERAPWKPNFSNLLPDIGKCLPKGSYSSRESMDSKCNEKADSISRNLEGVAQRTPNDRINK